MKRKEIDNLTEWVKRPQIGGTGLLWIKYNADSSVKSSFDKFFSEKDLKQILNKVSSKPGDIIFIMSGDKKNTLEHLGSLRVELAKRLLFVGFAIPMSMFMSLVILSAFGLTLNRMVLFGLVMGLGLLVDNGIVVVENIYRLMSKEGVPRIQAAKLGIGEVALPIIV